MRSPRHALRLSLLSILCLMPIVPALAQDKTASKADPAVPVIDEWVVAVLPASGEATVSSVNGKGMAVGHIRTNGGQSIATLWSDGKATSLGDADSTSDALSINEAGQAAGSRNGKPMLWQDGKSQELPGLTGYLATLAFQAKGKLVIGNAANGPQDMRAVMWTVAGNAYKIRELKSLGGKGSEVYALNADGLAVGLTDVDNAGTIHATAWRGNNVIDLGTYKGGKVSKAYGVNDKGLIVGGAYHADGHYTACSWTDGKISDLGTLPGHLESWSFGCNIRGEIIGWSADARGQQAVIWRDGKCIPLDQHLIKAAGQRTVSIVTAKSINEHGDIVGIALIDAKPAPVLLRRKWGADAKAEVLKPNPPTAKRVSRLIPLGDLEGGVVSSQATGVSEDGRTVIGFSSSAAGREAFRWTVAEGLQSLGDLPGGEVQSMAYDVSSDGSVIVGEATVAGEGPYKQKGRIEAFRWTSQGGMQGLGVLAGGAFGSQGKAVSADGKVVVGKCCTLLNGGNGKGYGREVAFTWSETGGMQALKNCFDFDAWSYASDVSADGKCIVGQCQSWSRAASKPVAWVDGNVLPLTKDTVQNGSLSAVSADGSSIAGSMLSRESGELDSYLLFGTRQQMRTVKGLMFHPNTIVGTQLFGFEVTFGDDRASVWSEKAGLRALDALLLQDGVDLRGWKLLRATDSTSDGKVLVGTGRNPQGHLEGWMLIWEH